LVSKAKGEVCDDEPYGSLSRCWVNKSELRNHPPTFVLMFG